MSEIKAKKLTKKKDDGYFNTITPYTIDVEKFVQKMTYKKVSSSDFDPTLESINNITYIVTNGKDLTYTLVGENDLKNIKNRCYHFDNDCDNYRLMVSYTSDCKSYKLYINKETKSTKVVKSEFEDIKGYKLANFATTKDRCIQMELF